MTRQSPSQVPARLGVVSRDADGTFTIRFERRLAHTPERVWTALSDPAEARQWFTEMTMEPRAGGRLHFDFGDQGEAHGEVLIWQPPHLLEHSWDEAGVTSYVRWELSAEDHGTRLILTHTRLSVVAPHEYGAGWHDFLDRLPLHLAGEPMPDDQNFQALVAQYVRLVTL